METVIRHVAAKWIPKLFRELTHDELALIKHALGDLPFEPSCGTVEILLDRARAGEVGLFILPGQADGRPCAVTFYQVEQFCDGSLNFDSLATVAIGPADRRLAVFDMPAMEALARSLGCVSMSMRTIRPGLVHLLTEQHGWYASEIIVRKVLTP